MSDDLGVPAALAPHVGLKGADPTEVGRLPPARPASVNPPRSLDAVNASEDHMTEARDQQLRGPQRRGRQPYEELVYVALNEPFTGWNFDYLNGRVRENPLPWSYEGLAQAELARPSTPLLGAIASRNRLAETGCPESHHVRSAPAGVLNLSLVGDGNGHLRTMVSANPRERR